MNVGTLPMLVEALNGNPIVGVITECVGRETNAIWRVSERFDQFAELLIQLGFGRRLIFVFGLWPDQMRKLQPFSRHIFGHDLRRLALAIQFPAIRNHRTIVKVACVFGGIIKAPQHLLIPRWLRFLGPDPLEFRRLGEPGARRGRRPEAWVMRRQMPSATPAHRKAANANPRLINGVMAA